MTAPAHDAHDREVRPAPELAAAMAETRRIRREAAELADRWDTQAGKWEKARAGTSDADDQLLHRWRAEMLRAHAAEVRELAGVRRAGVVVNEGNTQ